jgi:hypothetical protein
MVRLLLGALLLVPFLARRVAAQQDDRWQVALDDGGYVWDVRLVRLDGDTLVVSQSDSLVRVPLAHANEVRLIRKSRVDLTGGPATAGAMSALVGGNDEVYDLTALDPAGRKETVRKLLERRRAGP